MIGLSLSGEETRFCVVDAVGRILEEGSTHTSEVALRQLLASMPPSPIAVEFGPEEPSLFAALQGLGHTVFLGGPAPHAVVAALRPKVRSVVQDSERLTGRTAVASWRHFVREGDPVALRLMFSVDATGEVDDGWYFIGPIGSDVDLRALPRLATANATGAAAAEQARRLQQLMQLADESLTACVERAAA
jgi:hypothetical protein